MLFQVLGILHCSSTLRKKTQQGNLLAVYLLFKHDASNVNYYLLNNVLVRQLG